MNGHQSSAKNPDNLPHQATVHSEFHQFPPNSCWNTHLLQILPPNTNQHLGSSWTKLQHFSSHHSLGINFQWLSPLYYSLHYYWTIIPCSVYIFSFLKCHVYMWILLNDEYFCETDMFHLSCAGTFKHLQSFCSLLRIIPFSIPVSVISVFWYFSLPYGILFISYYFIMQKYNWFSFIMLLHSEVIRN